MQKNKSGVIAIVIVLAAAAGALVWIKYRQPVREPMPQNGLPAGERVEAGGNVISPVDQAALPPHMPQNLPLEQDALVLQNYESKNDQTGRQQSTRAYVSAKTPEENLEIYRRYLTDSGWSEPASFNQQDLKSLSADKDGDHLDAIFARDAASGRSTVTITVSYQ